LSQIEISRDTAETPSPPELVLSASRQFPEWLVEQGASLAFTTYQAGKLFLIGVRPDGRLSVFERTLARCMGLHASGNSLYVASLFQVWRFDNTLDPGESYNEHDRLFVPRIGWITGDLDIHDIALDANARPIFANTLFSCLATISEEASFAPIWQPAFISRLAAEDRCHLNGLAMAEGRPVYVTAVARTDVADGWREHRTGGGVLIEVASSETVIGGLSMPHSPRVYRGQVYLTNAGTGEFGRIDLMAGKFEPIAFCPGFLRGLAFIDHFAVVSLSLPRESRTFQGLQLDENLTSRGAVPRCGLMVIDLKTGDAPHWLRIEGIVKELYDVAVLEGVRRPAAIGFKTDEIRRVLKIGPAAAI
jgi:uncharacterized protein (TIGR03032 family)